MRTAVLIEPLPTKSEVLRACRGVEHTDHPLLRVAYELTSLHERRLTDGGPATEIDSRRAGLVRQIDRWVCSRLPPAPGSASVHTETLGAVVDRLAKYTITAYEALTSASEHDLGNAWEALAELAIGYEDLADELTAGRRRLPGGP
ncbi:DUF4254 domain-containing protein [Nocardia australiensis]|uniref:DUF4254 domain-containing protein n=1 Tax=Nocardia australiensis TaxID=2887191 RepID=UPI001D13F5C5|nr:DUF4254 domain-containing protein [Nocardia australiensis]